MNNTQDMLLEEVEFWMKSAIDDQARSLQSIARALELWEAAKFPNTASAKVFKDYEEEIEFQRTWAKRHGREMTRPQAEERLRSEWASRLEFARTEMTT